MDRLLPTLWLIALVLLVGCAALPLDDSSKQEQPARVVLNNSANVTQTFDIIVLELGSKYTIYRNDSDTGNSTIDEGVSSYSTARWHLTAVEFPESAHRHGEYTLEPGEGKEVIIENISEDEGVVVLLSEAEKIGWIGTVSCSDGELVYFHIVGREGRTGGDASATYSCDGFL